MHWHIILPHLWGRLGTRDNWNPTPHQPFVIDFFVFFFLNYTHVIQMWISFAASAWFERCNFYSLTVNIPHSVKLLFHLAVIFCISVIFIRLWGLCQFRLGSVLTAIMVDSQALPVWWRNTGRKHTYLLSASALHFGDSSSKDLVNLTTWKRRRRHH